MTPTGSPVDPLFLSFQLALAGRYSIDRELGRGGMGVVYLAREVHLDRMVAIKLLPPERARDEKLRDRFLREARLAAKLSHPNIIPIHAVDERGEFVFYVMAFIDGETLANRIRTRGPLSSSEGARVMREVAWALGHAHSHGLVHRDVKPDNILLEQATGRVLVADFGIAAAMRDVGGTTVSGTPEFMSPEQALGQDVDARSDLYSLGITGFYLFSGRLPFEGTSPTNVLAKQVTEAPPSLGSMGIPVSRKIAALVDRCIAKDPNHRPESAEALAERLGIALEQRREMPAALRAFVKRNSRMNGGGTMVFPAGLLLGATSVSAAFGVIAGISVFALGAVATPLVFLVAAARKLMRLGFAYSDVAPAYATEIELGVDERAISGGIRGAGRGERLARVLMKASAAVFAISAPVLIALLSRGRLSHAMFLARDTASFLLAGSMMIGLPSTFLYLASVDRRRDIDTDFWAKIWAGRLGKFAFAVAKRFLGKGVRASAITHRATELSLGMAAESLFDNLPAAIRKPLGNLPQTVRKLQDDAQRLRKLYEEQQEALGGLENVADSPDYQHLRAQKDIVHTKLTHAVGALETIRLNLLRLHAGSGSVEGLTTHVDLAAELSAEVDRLLAARRDVERTLSFPRPIAVTPV